MLHVQSKKTNLNKNIADQQRSTGNEPIIMSTPLTVFQVNGCSIIIYCIFFLFYVYENVKGGLSKRVTSGFWVFIPPTSSTMDRGI